jgi:copper chaperone CopZ
MKAIKLFAATFAVACITLTVNAQSKTETFKVSGNCGMCKTKIEKAAKEAGAKEATWDSEKQQVTVTYKTSTTNAAKIQQKIAEVGYDNAGFKATTEAYNKLHGCCKYERTTASDNAGHSCCSGKEKCSKDNHETKLDCCKDGKCTKAGDDGKDCCKKEGHH